MDGVAAEGADSYVEGREHWRSCLGDWDWSENVAAERLEDLDSFWVAK